MGGSSSTKVDSIGGDLEEEIRHRLFRWPRYFDGRDACLRSRSRRRGSSREQDGIDSRGDRRRIVKSAELPSDCIRDEANGAYLGLVPRRYQSGEVDYTGGISKCGDGRVRTLLYEAANVMLTRYKGQLKLKDWAFAIAKRSTMR
jgi:transposase